MLLKNYNPNKGYLNNDNIQTMDTTTLFDTFKNIKYPTTPLSIFDNIPTNTILSLFEEQYKLIEIEANTYLKYQFLSQSAYNSTLEQYNALFYYNEHFYKKSELKKYISDQHDSFATIISNPNPLPPQISIAQQTNSQKKQVIKINRKRIRNITGYSPDFIPKRSETGTPIYVERQDQLIRDTHDIILVIASRQCGKSYSLSEKAIEESFIHNNDILVGAFTNDTTKVIRNYILKFIRKFPETTFNHNKAERYIQNMETGSKIYMRSLADDAVDGVRGLTLNTIIVDEAQKVSEYAFNEVLEPTLATTGGKMILIGTPPKSLTGFFVESILKYKRGELPYASYYEIPLDKQPFTHPKVRNRVSEQKHLSHIRRERYCSLEASEDRLFNPKLATEYPQLNSNGYFVLGIDPARKHDRSGYCLSYTANGKANIILSGFVPDRFKGNNQTSQYWKLQAIFFERLIQPYRKFGKIITVMDSSGVGDGVVTIFNDAGFKIHNTIRYTSGATYTAKGLDYTVSKSVLINNTLNFIDEELLEIVDVTNKDLIEEMKYIYEAETKKRVITFESKFFDDITNAMMINLFIVKERRLINRDTTSNQHNQTIPTSGIKMVDAFDETYRKPLKANHLKSRNRSSTW